MALGMISLVQILTVIVSSMMFLAVCGIQIAAKLLTFCAWAEPVLAVICLIPMIGTIFEQNLISPLYNALEELCIITTTSLLPLLR